MTSEGNAGEFKRDSTRDKGSRGESLAERFLKGQRFKILTRNYHKPYGEVDLVCMDGDELVFVEVKTSRQPDFGPPETWVTRKKQRQITKAAQAFLLEKHIEGVDCRFDVIGISFYADRKPEINHIRDAFRL